jgi:DnaJ-class molecular chaperone
MSDAKDKPGDEVAPGTPQSGEAPCPACGGKGQVEGRPCGSCGGTGTITALVGDA